MKIASLVWIASLALLFALPSNASRVRLSQAQGTMLVSGTVHIASNGSVTSYSLDQPEKLPDEVRKVIAKTVPTWIFAPVVVDGKRMPGVSHMVLRLLAKPLSKDQYAVSVHGARFGEPGNDQGVAYSDKRQARPHPRYPVTALRYGMGGTAFVVARVDRQGRVTKIAVPQVNLDKFGTQAQMKRCREAFATEATRAIKNWTFRPPTGGLKVAADHWDISIPVAFHFSDMPGAKPKPAANYGKWQVYLPGPHNKIAWLDTDQPPANSTDVLPGGSLASASQSRHLLTPLGGSSDSAGN